MDSLQVHRYKKTILDGLVEIIGAGRTSDREAGDEYRTRHPGRRRALGCGQASEKHDIV